MLVIYLGNQDPVDRSTARRVRFPFEVSPHDIKGTVEHIVVPLFNVLLRIADGAAHSRPPWWREAEPDSWKVGGRSGIGV